MPLAQGNHFIEKERIHTKLALSMLSGLSNQRRKGGVGEGRGL